MEVLYRKTTMDKLIIAGNSGLKIWRVSGKSEMAQLFNLKFFLYLCWLGFGWSPHFQATKRWQTLKN